MTAPETTAPELSTMVPARVPRSDCATAVKADAASRVAIVTHFRTEFSQPMIAPITTIIPISGNPHTQLHVPRPDLEGTRYGTQFSFQRSSWPLMLKQLLHWRGRSL